MPIKNLPRLTQGSLLAVKSLGKNVIYTDTQHFWGAWPRSQEYCC